MAVIEDLGLSVAVHISGAPAVEYNDPDPAPDPQYPAARVITRYIEARDDAEYSIRCLTLPQNEWLTATMKSLVFQAHIDGVYQAGKCHFYPDVYHQIPSYIDGVQVQAPQANHQTIRKFKFSTVTTVEASASTVRQHRKLAAELGTIRVHVWRGLDWGTIPLNKSTADSAALRIAEKALKGRSVSHGTSLAAPVPTNAIAWADVRYVDGQPCAIFAFKYRSKAALRSEMVVPRTPSPDPAAGGFEGLSQGEVQRLARERFEELKVKQEEKPAPKVKREFDEMLDIAGDNGHGESRRAKKRRERKKPETIDLTDD